MDVRFTASFRSAIQRAHQVAREWKHEYIGTEHLLVGLVGEALSTAPNSVTAFLAALQCDITVLPTKLSVLIQHGPDVVSLGKLPNTPRAKKVVELAVEAASSRHQACDIEHMLIGLCKEREGCAAQVLESCGVTYEALLGLMPMPAAKTVEAKGRTYTLHLAPATKLNVVEAAGEKPACETCRFWDPTFEDEGQCRRHAPRAVQWGQNRGEDEDAGDTFALWPTVPASMWCGEYERAAEAVK
jgi:ATP-dependent Clp protease ATP-binding subunit ClpA